MSEPATSSSSSSPWMWVGKLAPPQMQPDAARRDALLTRLHNYRRMPLMLVTSPPGFGKTTLLAQWREALLADTKAANAPIHPVAWLSLDEADRDVGRFFAYLLLALEAAGLGLEGLAPLAHEQTLDAVPERTVGTLRQLLARDGRRFTLMLDDYHSAASPEVDALALMLLERTGEHLQLIVATRTRPPWPLSRLKLRGLVHELDANDLILSLSEAGQILGAGMDRSELAVVHSRTEGWAVAIQLARLWLLRASGSSQGLREFSGHVSEMAEYLAEQIVDQLPADCRAFLLETSLLERFDAQMADVVRGRDDSAGLLARLLPYESLLVPLDPARSWFRYHHMLVDFLRPRLDARRAREIHRAAAHWLARQTDWVLAVSHALKAQDLALAIEMLRLAGGWELVVRKGIPYAQSLLAQFDDMARRTEPELLLIQAYLHAKLGDEALSMELLRLGAAGVPPDAPLPLRRNLEVITAVTRAYVDRLEDAAQWRVDPDEATARYPEDPMSQAVLLCVGAVAGLAWGQLGHAAESAEAAYARMRAAASPLGENYCLMHWSSALALSGQMAASRQRIDQALALADANFGIDSSLKALVGCYKAQHLYLQGQWADVTPWLSAGQESLEKVDAWPDVFANTGDIAWRVALRQEGLAGALAALERSAQIARRRSLKRLSRLVLAWRVDLLVQCGMLPQAQQEAHAAALEAELPMTPQVMAGQDFDWRFLEAGTLALARLQMAGGAAQAAATRLERAARCMEEASLALPAWRLKVMGLLAQRKAREGDLPEAAIRQVLTPILQQGLSGLLLDAGPAVLQLLPGLDDLLPPQSSQLITQLRGWQTHPPRRRAQFSGKEEQVLELLVSGQANKAIARALDISENTVKFHLKQIFQKLSVDSRGAAISAALQQGFKSS